MPEAQDPPRQQFYGIDFSGAADPRDDLWITEAKLEDSTLQVRNSQSAGTQFNGTSREEILSELVEFIAAKPDSVFALDFPFGLPKQVHENRDDLNWSSFIERFPRDFANVEDDPHVFRIECAEKAGSCERSYQRRETDWRRAGQCPYAVQIQYQTYFGISQLLSPLVEHTQALPMEGREPDVPWIIETYPAAVFGRLGLYRSGYKGRSAGSDEKEKRRAANVQSLNERNDVKIDSDVRRKARNSDDALDSLACAFAAYRSLTTEEIAYEDGDVEGWIYV